MSASFTEYRHQEIGCTIHDLCQRCVASLRINETAKAYTLSNVIKITHNSFELREKVDRAQSGSFSSLQVGHIHSQFTAMGICNLAVRAEAQLPRHKHEATRSNGG